MTRDSSTGPEPPGGDERDPLPPPEKRPGMDDASAEDADGTEASSPSRGAAGPGRSRGGRALAVLALLLALVALGGSGWLYYRLVHLAEPEEPDAGLRETRTALDELEGRVERALERQRQALEAFREQERQTRAEAERALRESLSEVARQAPPSTGEWRRAEAQYLLRIANHRLLMERDVEGALRLLEAADAVLAELDDFALHEVRARLADEIAALERVQGIDLQGLFLRLEAAKGELDALPLRLPEYLKPEPPPPPAGGGFWEVLERELSAMVNVRRLGSEVKPLLAPEEGAYLEMNLRLMLERAQLAALRREQAIYEESLVTAAEWVRRYLDVEEPVVRRLLDELDALQNVELARPLPDISGSLNALQAVLRNPA